MKILRDLLYTKGNGALDVARLSSLLSVIAFWVGVFWLLAIKGEFDPLAVGAGWAALAGGAAAWIHFRQKHEDGAPSDPAAGA